MVEVSVEIWGQIAYLGKKKFMASFNQMSREIKNCVFKFLNTSGG